MRGAGEEHAPVVIVIPAHIVLDAGQQPAYSFSHCLIPVKLPGLIINTYRLYYLRFFCSSVELAKAESKSRDLSKNSRPESNAHLV
jgi:hypothetical protein